MIQDGIQNLLLMEKRRDAIHTRVICEVPYVPLMGRYGADEE